MRSIGPSKDEVMKSAFFKLACMVLYFAFKVKEVLITDILSIVQQCLCSGRRSFSLAFTMLVDLEWASTDLGRTADPN